MPRNVFTPALLLRWPALSPEEQQAIIDGHNARVAAEESGREILARERVRVAAEKRREQKASNGA